MCKLVLKMSVGTKALELTVDHDGKPVTESLALLHTGDNRNYRFIQLNGDNYGKLACEK